MQVILRVNQNFTRHLRNCPVLTHGWLHLIFSGGMQLSLLTFKQTHAVQINIHICPSDFLPDGCIPLKEVYIKVLYIEPLRVLSGVSYIEFFNGSHGIILWI